MTNDSLSLTDRRLAYQRLRSANANAPQILFLGGFASDMQGTKATYLAERCRQASYGFLRFDYRGHGGSEGNFNNSTLGDWYADAKAVLERLSEGPQIIVGSSMGGWLALLLARQFPERLRALIGVSAAPDFTEDLIWDKLDMKRREALLANGRITEHPNTPSGDGNPVITLRLIEEARSYLVLRQNLNILCPIRLLHGMKDADVPCDTALRLIRHVDCPDARLTLIKDGDHRLNRPQDLDLIWQTIQGCAEAV